MSYTTILSVWPGEKNECYRELKNSFGSAPIIWNNLCQKYYGTIPFSFFRSGNAIDKLWSRWKDPGIPEHQRAVLLMTFDRAYILKKNYPRATKDIKMFLYDFPPKDPEKYLNHWPEIMEIFKSDPDIPAIGFWHTSVTENLFDGRWNEEKGEYDMPDWNDFYEIYEELDSIKNS